MSSTLPKVQFLWMVEEDEARKSAVSQITVVPRAKAAETLAEFAREAADGDAGAANCHGVCLGALGRTEEAIAAFRAALAAHPRSFMARFNLAKCCFESGQLRLAMRELRTAEEHAEGTVYQRLIRQVSRGLTSWVEDRTRQAAFLRLRTAMLRERVDRGIAEPGDALGLGRALIELSAEHGDETPPGEVVAVLERAHEEDPSDAAALELLAGALAMGGPSERLTEVFRELEAVAPHSSLLERIRSAATAGPRPVDQARIQRLTQDAIGDGPEAAAAVDDLRDLSRAAPNDLNLRLVLMMAVTTRDGGLPEALDLAERLVADSDSHTTHFNVAQVHWANGDVERAQHHVRRAFDLASDDGERQDVMNLVAFLRERGPRG
ncbi:tetratricopeptide repeat protein [Actinomadura chibensis]|uniref:Tetratricopeptide repeat protein n=1 Tax=Actinomadura chibensis TaxID=392828 RepID=A0A5D0NLP4_9ACTN|nr:tetratricopeptide repeat protein [Actinomadura chibensis]TYB45372.1 tetratricopeptide repeat protein [Actinomadura chibensis]